MTNETAMMLVRAVWPKTRQRDKDRLFAGQWMRAVDRNDILAMAAAVDAREKALREAAQALIADCKRCGLGDLADQIDPKLVAALEAALKEATHD